MEDKNKEVIERFRAKVKELQDQRPGDYKESESVFFGFTIDRGDEVFRVVDFGNIEKFIIDELATREALARKEAVEEYSKDIRNIFDAVKSRYDFFLSPSERLNLMEDFAEEVMSYVNKLK